MKRTIFFFPAILWAGIILWLSFLPGKDIPKWWFFEAIYFDKWVHVSIYLIFSFLLISGTAGSKNIFPSASFQLIIVLLAMSYGIMIEILQETLTTTRHFEWADIAADTAGALLGVMLARYAKKKKMFFRAG